MSGGRVFGGGWLVVGVLVVLGVVGCGGSGGVVVARVGGSVVSERLVDHWVRFQAVTDFEPHAQTRAPAWVVPDPPRFAACVAHMRAGESTGVRAREASLRGACAHQLDLLRRRVLTVLIHWDWLLGEARELGIKVTSREARAQFTRFNREVFGGEQPARRYIANTGLTLAEELYRMKIELLESKLQERAQQGARTSQQKLRAVASFDREMIRRWAAKTNCSRSFVVEGCSEYKTTTSPA